MHKTPPTYLQQNKAVVADRCKPLIRAVEKNELAFHALARAGYPGNPLYNNELPGLLSLGFWDAITDQSWGLPTHYNEGIELACLETGSLIFHADKKYTLKPGSLTITRPWQPHSLGDPNITPGRLYWIILDVGVRKPHQKWQWPDWFVLTAADLKKLTTLLRQNETPIWPAGTAVMATFRQIGELIRYPERSLRLSQLTILINELFLQLYETLNNRAVKLKPELTTSQRTVELFLDNLKGNKNFLSRQWTVPTMAEHCDLGVTHFTRLCKTLSNMTPMQYLNQQRIEAAIAMLLSDPELSITDVAYRSGFNSSQYFATVFKRFKGCSPHQYLS